MNPDSLFKGIVRAAVAFAFLLVYSSESRAADVHWINPAGGNWSDPANWSSGTIPAAEDNVFITAEGVYTVLLDQNAAALNLSIGASSGAQALTITDRNLAISGTAEIGTNGRLGVAAGTLSGKYLLNGTVNWIGGRLSGALTIATDGLLELQGDASKFLDGANITNAGSIVWAGGGDIIYNGGRIENTAEGTIEIQNSQSISQSTGILIIDNAGLIRKTASGISTLGAQINNTGMIQAQTGTIKLARGGRIDGTYSASPDAVIDFSGGNFTLIPTFEFSGAGYIGIATGSATLTGTLTKDFKLNGSFSEGRLNGNQLIIASTLTWLGGRMSGTVTIATNGILKLEGDAGKFIDGTIITNAGGIVWTGGGDIIYNGGRIENTAEGTIEIQNSQSISQSTGTLIIDNAGLIRKSAGTGMTLLTSVSNVGLIQVESGILRMDPDNFDGIFEAAEGAEIQFTGGTFNGPPAFIGPGKIGFTANAQIRFTVPITNFELKDNAVLVGTNVVTGTLTWTSGAIQGRLSIVDGGTLKIDGSIHRTFAGELINDGTIEWLGTAGFGLRNSGIILNRAGGVLDIRSDETISTENGTVFDNFGLVQKSAGTNTSAIHVPFNNSGRVEAHSGILFLTGGALAGTFTASEGAEIQLAGAVFDAPPSFNGPGKIGFAPNSGIYFTSPITDFNLSGGILLGTNIVTGILTWTGGAVQGQLTVAGAGILRMDGSTHRTFRGELINEGTIEWLGAAGLGVARDSVIRNRAGAVVRILSDQILSTEPDTVFENFGTVSKSSGTNTTQIHILFENFGMIHAQNGEIDFSALELKREGVLNYVLGGKRPGIDYGQIGLAGHLVLDGTLKTSLTNGFIPAIGDSFDVLTFGSRSSGFLRDEGLELFGDPFFRVAITNQSLSFITGSLLGIPLAPATNLVDQVVAVGRPVTFRIEPLGATPFTYRWQFNGNNIPRATNSSYTINSAQTANAGLYTVQVTDNSGLTLAYSANLRVVLPPTITTQPASQTVPVGARVSLTVGVGGEGPHFYQWRLNGANIPGATNESYSIPNAQPISGGSYSVTFENPVGAVRSGVATVIVDTPEILFSDGFAGRPALSAASGFGRGSNTNATRETNEPDHANKRGGRSVWLEWRAPANGIAKFSTRGSTFDTLLAVYIGGDLPDLIPVASDDDRGGFFTSEAAFQAAAGSTYLIAIDGLAGASGDIALSWSLDTTVSAIPRIVAHPANRAVQAGATASFTVLATSTGTLTYQWLFNDYLRIEGATNPTVILQNVQPADAGRYSVEITNQNDQRVRSEAASLEVNTDSRSFSEDKFDDLFERNGLGAFARVSAKAAGFPPVSSGTLGTQILNNFNSTIELGEPLHAAVIGGSSRWFPLRAVEQGTMVIDTIGSAIDTVLAVYTGVDIFSLREIASDNDGAFDGIRSRVRFEAEAGTDYMIVIDGLKGAQGDLVVNWGMGQAPALAQVPSAQTLKAGENARFEVVANGQPAPKFQWQFEGRNIPQATESTLVLTNVTAAHAGRYRVIVSNFIGAITSEEFVFTVQDALLILNPASLRIDNGRLRFSVENAESGRILVESTEQLGSPVVWTPVWTNNTTSPSADFTEPNLEVRPRRFYRARFLQ